MVRWKVGGPVGVADQISVPPRAENWREGGDILLSNITFYIQKLIAPLRQTVNPSDRKFDKSFSSLVSLYCSHYLPVVTSKLFFSSNCLILPFSITRKIYRSRPVTEFNFVVKKEIQNCKKRRERDAHHQVSLNVQ